MGSRSVAGGRRRAGRRLRLSPDPERWGWGAVGAYLALDLLVIVLVSLWSHRAGWGGRHLLALAGGAALAYAWHAFLETPAVGPSGMVDRVGNAVFAIALLVLLGMAARRTPPHRCRAGLGRPESLTQFCSLLLAPHFHAGFQQFQPIATGLGFGGHLLHAGEEFGRLHFAANLFQDGAYLR